MLWGLAYFGQKYASTKSLPPHVFALAWYLGSAPIAGLFYLKKRNEAVRLERSDWKKIVLLSGVLYVSMASSIIAFRAPQIVVQPIFFAAEIALPVLMGLFLFHERKKVVGIEWLFFTLGIFGTALIVHAFAMR